MVEKLHTLNSYGGVNTRFGVVEEVIHSVEELVPTVRWRSMVELWGKCPHCWSGDGW